VVRLQPVEDLGSELLHEVLAGHARLLSEDLKHKDLDKAAFDMLVLIVSCRDVLIVLDFRAALGLATLARSLIPVSAVQTEHELVRDFVEEGDV